VAPHKKIIGVVP